MPRFTTPADVLVTAAGAAGRDATGLFVIDAVDSTASLVMVDGTPVFGHLRLTQGAAGRDGTGLVL